jgi:fatty-acyl-CoA synthase
MAALELHPGTSFDPAAFAGFLAAQDDLGTKWAPRYIRVVGDMPLTGTNKVMKAPLQRAGWVTGDAVYRRPGRDLTYSAMTTADRDALAAEFAEHRRTAFLPASGA